MQFLPLNYLYRLKKPISIEIDILVLHQGHKRNEISLSARIRHSL